MPYIKKMIYAGKQLEIEKYPVSKKGSRIPRGGKHQLSSESQSVINEKNSKKNFLRLVECNFTTDDLFLTLKYKGIPPGSAQLKKDFQNFLRRLKYHARKEGYPEPVYMGVSHDSTARPHHHLILNQYPWDFIRSLWTKGSIHISNLTSDDEFGFTAVAKYIMNEKNNNTFEKRWCSSQNLKKPKIVYKEIKRLSIYQKIEAPKGYRIISIDITDNVFTGIHQYVKCVKLE